MKSILAALILAPMALVAAAQTPEATALRVECAAKNLPAASAKDSNEYSFVYRKGEYRGETQGGKFIGCNEKQYTAYLASADPVRVMSAYPTAAGRLVNIKPDLKAAAKAEQAATQK